MDAVRSGSLPKSPIHATGKRPRRTDRIFRGNTPSGPGPPRLRCSQCAATAVVAVAKPGPCGIPKKPHQRREARATELSQSPPARRQGVPSGTNIRRCVIAARHKGVLADTVDPAQRFRRLSWSAPPREL